MLSEKKLKENLINGLNKINQDWIDGDTENSFQKTADIVNHLLKVAIEIKDDTKSQPPQKVGSSYSGSYDAKKLNKRFFNYIKNANKKFREYQQYKTSLLIRTNLPMTAMVRNSIEGIHTFERFSTGKKIVPLNAKNFIISQRLTYSGRKDKHNRSEVGCFLVFNIDGYSYFPNEFATNIRKMDKAGIEFLFGFNFCDA